MIKVFTLSLLILSSLSLTAQDIDELLNEATGNDTEYTSATFKATRIVTGHSIERMPAGQLDFRIAHRFGRVNGGAYEFFGLDQANIHLGLDYGITDWLMAGIGRGNYEKTYDALIKLSILRQSKGEINMPVSVSYLATVAVNTLKWEGDEELEFANRLSYVHQLLVGRKVTDRLSLQLSPSFVHRNLVDTRQEPNDIWSLGFGGRFKITKRVSLNAEYYHLFTSDLRYSGEKVYPPLSVGFDIETGGHVFQLHFSNSVGMIEKAFIGETTGDWLNGDIHIGFNISRVFTLN